MITYKFDRPAYVMLAESVAEGLQSPSPDSTPSFAHIVTQRQKKTDEEEALQDKPDNAKEQDAPSSLVGAVGIKCRVLKAATPSTLPAPPPSSKQRPPGFPPESTENAVKLAALTCLPMHRVKVESVEKTFPFPVASVVELRDDPPADGEAMEEALNLERSVFKAMADVISLSRDLESKLVPPSPPSSSSSKPSSKNSLAGGSGAPPSPLEGGSFPAGGIDIIGGSTATTLPTPPSSSPYASAGDPGAGDDAQELLQRQQAEGSLPEDAAAEELDRVARRLDRFRVETVDGELGLNPTLRMEAFGFLVADLLQLDFETATEVFHTTSAAERFRLLLAFLDPLRSELAAMKSLDSMGMPSSSSSDSSSTGSAGDDDVVAAADAEASRVADLVSGGSRGGAGAARPPGGKGAGELGLQKGMRLEYWYNEEWGWCSGKLVKEQRVSLAGETVSLWTFRYDSDGSEQQLRLTLENKPRWRLLRSSGK